jgi:hypothetical protein
MGNITSHETLQLLDLYVMAGHYSGLPSVSDAPYGCNVGGFLTLIRCPSSSPGTLLQSMTLAGSFVPETWMTADGRKLAIDEVLIFYGTDDYKDMANVGMNVVCVPVPFNAFSTMS